MAGHKTFSLTLWKQAVEIIKKSPRVSVERLANELGCTEKVAFGMKTDYRKLKSKK